MGYGDGILRMNWRLVEICANLSITPVGSSIFLALIIMAIVAGCINSCLCVME